MLVNPVLTSSNSQANTRHALILAKRLAFVHKLVVYIVVVGALYIPFASVQILIVYTGYFIIVGVVPFCNKGKCPLTLLEKKWITLGGGTPYQESFIPHYFPFVVPPHVKEGLVENIGKALILFILIMCWIFK